MGWTFQSLIDADMTIHAYCHRSSCGHGKQLDLEALRSRLGPDAAAMHDDLVPRLRCERCGGKDVGLIYSPKSNELRRPKDPPGKI